MEGVYFHVLPGSAQRRALLTYVWRQGRRQCEEGNGRAAGGTKLPGKEETPADHEHWRQRFGRDGERQQLENALTKNTGLGVVQAPLRTYSLMVLTGVKQ